MILKQNAKLLGIQLFHLVWILALDQAISSELFYSFELRSSLESRLGLDVLSPGSNAPLYFVAEDFIAGVQGLLALLCGLALAVISWHLCPVASWIVQIGLGTYLVSAIITIDIYQRCPRIFGEQHGSCPWSTFDMYLANDFHLLIHCASSLILFLYMAWLTPRVFNHPHYECLHNTTGSKSVPPLEPKETSC